jgi:VanZ family protein
MRHIPWIGWWILTWLLSVMPAQELPRFTLWNADKAIHFVFYFCQLALFHWASPSAKKSSLFLALLSFAASGGLIEWIQGYCIPGRFADPYDLLANLLGLGSAFLLFRRFAAD